MPPTWLFDLDNTLHNASAHIFPRINHAMTAYLQRHLQISEAEANALRQHYWRRYGATLLGLMRHHGTDPHHFLAETHCFENLPALVVFHPAVRHCLAHLPGRKVLFSNAPTAYARDILSITGLHRLIPTVYAIERLGMHPKPQAAPYRQLLTEQGLKGHECIMVEDSAENLLSAKRLGMRTVWVSRHTRVPPWVDVRISDILQLRTRLRHLGIPPR